MRSDDTKMNKPASHNKLYQSLAVIIAAVVMFFLTLIVRYAKDAWGAIGPLLGLMAAVYLLIMGGLSLWLLYKTVRERIESGAPLQMLPLAASLLFLTSFALRMLGADPAGSYLMKRDLLCRKAAVQAYLNDNKRFPKLSEHAEYKMLKLPTEHAAASGNEGKIALWESKDRKAFALLFYNARPFLDSWAGTVYTADDRNPFQTAFPGKKQSIERIEKNWYYVSSW